MDQIGSGSVFDQCLLRTSVANEMREKIRHVIGALNLIDHSHFLKKHSFFHRFTGADIEASLRFETSIEVVFSLIDELNGATNRAQDLLTKFETARSDLVVEQEHLDHVITISQKALKKTSNVDEYLLSRFESRLSLIHI